MIKFKKKNEGKYNKSFYFEEYNHSQNNVNDKFNISQDRIYLLFFYFFH